MTGEGRVRSQVPLPPVDPRTAVRPCCGDTHWGPEPIDYPCPEPGRVLTRSEQKVRDRMDPDRARNFDHSRQPRPFWLDPQKQTIGLGDDRVWTHVPIHDPAWWWTL